MSPVKHETTLSLSFPLKRIVFRVGIPDGEDSNASQAHMMKKVRRS